MHLFIHLFFQSNVSPVVHKPGWIQRHQQLSQQKFIRSYKYFKYKNAINGFSSSPLFDCLLQSHCATTSSIRSNIISSHKLSFLRFFLFLSYWQERTKQQPAAQGHHMHFLFKVHNEPGWEGKVSDGGSQASRRTQIRLRGKHGSMTGESHDVLKATRNNKSVLFCDHQPVI